ncbi:MAG TPA: hypothetical protein VK191_14660 [Symbiobacteriaceae bacterium]|nr:hypothetical protein [Symbiobacteriaceae bacterium]
MRLFWRGALLVLLVVGVGLILWLPWPWNLAVGALVGLKLSAAIALLRLASRRWTLLPPPGESERSSTGDGADRS